MDKLLFSFLYALSFSYAYFSLDAGLGALILFACVQLSMIAFAFLKKEQITKKKLLGVVLAFTGLFYLLFPSKDFEVSSFHFLLMAISGISWAIYTVLGKVSKEALKDTTDSFIKAFFFVVLFFLIFIDKINISFYGGFLAFISGAFTSALAYSLWYYLLKHMKILTASIIQLLVPVIAIFISVLFLGEALSFKFLLSSIIILSGIAISLYEKN